jgi:hypothetical protein
MKSSFFGNEQPLAELISSMIIWPLDFATTSNSCIN